MASVSLRFNNVNSTVARLRSQVNEKLPFVAEMIKSDCNQYVRKQDGTLAESAHVEDGGRKIVWSTAYAKRVYYTGTPRKNVNPNASLRWCEVAKRQYASDWANYLTKLVNGG